MGVGEKITNLNECSVLPDLEPWKSQRVGELSTGCVDNSDFS